MTILPELAAVAPWLEQHNCRSLFLVLDRVAYEESGAAPILAGTPRIEFDAFEPNPKLNDIKRGLELFRERSFDTMLALGGGTAIDIAKAIRCFAAQDRQPIDLLQGKVKLKPNRGCPLIAVPTTAGTGSEATHFAVIYVDGVKFSLADASLRPDVAVLDAGLTASLPPQVTATTGLDALCQAIESLWSIHSTSESVRFAEESLDLAWNHLQPAVLTPTTDHRQAMLRAAHLAGKAIDITKTTAPHALSYKITADYGVPHGHAVALTLGAFLQFNAAVTGQTVADPRGVAHVRDAIFGICAQMGASDPCSAAKRFTELVTSIGCSSRLSELGVNRHNDLASLAASVNAQRLSNNPRTASAQDLRDILDSVY